MKKTRKIKPRSDASKTTIAMDMENPHFNAAHPASNANPIKASVQVKITESPAIWMYAHGRISESQLRAASSFRLWYESAGGASIQAMDTTKEPVDGGKVSDGLTDRKMKAAKELAAARSWLGPQTYDVVEKVCGQCLWIKELDPRRQTQDRYSQLLKRGLDQLAFHWGYTSKLKC
jgi:hypothetical protein